MKVNFWKFAHNGNIVGARSVGGDAIYLDDGTENGDVINVSYIGKLLSRTRAKIDVEKVAENIYMLSTVMKVEQIASQFKRSGNAVSRMINNHRAYAFQDTSAKMLEIVSKVTHYQSTDVPVIEGLKRQPTMYQLQNALWMEHVENSLDQIEIETSNGYRYEETGPHGVIMKPQWWSPDNGTTNYPQDERTFRIQGGCLLDEAGIGKTMSSLIHSYYNNRADPSGFTLNEGTSLVESGATLIVTRNHLVKQWEDEINEVFDKGPTTLVIRDSRQWKKLYAREIVHADFIIVSLELLATNHNKYEKTVFDSQAYRNFYAFREHNVKKAKEMTPTTEGSSLHSFHFNRVVYDEIQNLYAKRSLLGTSYANPRNVHLRAINITARHRWGLSASAFQDEKDITDILCILCEQSGQTRYTFEEYYPLLDYYEEWAGLIFRRNTRESIAKEIPMRKVTRQICRIKPTVAEMRIYRSIMVEENTTTIGARVARDLRMFCACPRLMGETAELQEFGNIDDVARNLYSKYQGQIDEQTRSLKERELSFAESLITYKDFMKTYGYTTIEVTCYEDTEGYNPDCDAHDAAHIAALRNNIRNAQLKISNTEKKIDTLSRCLRFMKEEVIGAINREEITECPVCFYEFSADLPVNVTKCGHMFCSPCIKSCINNNHICPTCKTAIKSLSDIYVVSPPTEFNASLDTLGSKVSILVSALRKVINETNENVIVFSEWDNLLKYTGKLLNSVGIKTLFMSGNANAKTSTLRKFNATDDYRVLMLSSKKSAEGTNLTRATKIFFMDPVYGENRERIIHQAIGRSMRMNQKSDIEVINLVLAGTIEEQEIGNLESGLMDIQIDLNTE